MPPKKPLPPPISRRPQNTNKHPGLPDVAAPRRSSEQVQREKAEKEAKKKIDQQKAKKAITAAAAVEDRLQQEDLEREHTANHPQPPRKEPTVTASKPLPKHKQSMTTGNPPVPQKPGLGKRPVPDSDADSVGGQAKRIKGKFVIEIGLDDNTHITIGGDQGAPVPASLQSKNRGSNSSQYMEVESGEEDVSNSGEQALDFDEVTARPKRQATAKQGSSNLPKDPPEQGKHIIEPTVRSHCFQYKTSSTMITVLNTRVWMIQIMSLTIVKPKPRTQRMKTSLLKTKEM